MDELCDEAAQQSLSGGRFAAQVPIFDETTRHGKGGISDVAIERCDVAREQCKLKNGRCYFFGSYFSACGCGCFGWARLWNVSLQV